MLALLWAVQLLSQTTANTDAIGSPRPPIDICYITPRLAVCSGPLAHLPSRLYRTPVSALVRWLDAQHGAACWQVFNLRAEPLHYSPSDMDGRVVYFPFADHTPPPFRLLRQVVAAITDYITNHPRGVAVVHCKAGKGRLGVVMCCVLMQQFHLHAPLALAVFSYRRMAGNRTGVLIASQQRYLLYWDRLSGGRTYEATRAALVWVKVMNPQYSQIQVEVGMHHSPSAHGMSLVNTAYTTADRDMVHRSKTCVGWMPRCGSQPVVVEEEFRLCLTHTLPGTRVVLAVASAWLNLHFEGGARGTAVLRWNEFDGFKGTCVRGLWMFDSVEVHWERH